MAKYYVIHLVGSDTWSYGPFEEPLTVEDFLNEISDACHPFDEERGDTLISVKLNSKGSLQTDVLSNDHLTWVLNQRK
jgi:hypothetical protein